MFYSRAKARRETPKPHAVIDYGAVNNISVAERDKLLARGVIYLDGDSYRVAEPFTWSDVDFYR